MKSKPCETKTFESYVKRLRDVTHIMTLSELKAKEEENQLVKKIPCKKSYQQEGKKKISTLVGLKQACAEEYSRNWNASWFPCRLDPLGGFQRGFGRKRKGEGQADSWWKKCHEQVEKRFQSFGKERSKVPKCKPQIPCKTQIDDGVCIFCLGSIYTGGYIHELYEKTPLIIKQSELYGDEIAWRIGKRTRVMVHKKCYKDYIDVLSRETDKEDVGVNGFESLEEDSSDFCGIYEDEEEEEEEVEKNYKNIDYSFRGSNHISRLSWDEFSKPGFCLRKFELPRVPSGKIPFVQ